MNKEAQGINHGCERSYCITTTAGAFVFTGTHRKDLESENWHYYEKQDGGMLHFRKGYMVAVEENKIAD